MNRSFRHHIVVLIVIATLLVLFSYLRKAWLPEMHYQNKAFGDISLIMIAFTLFLGTTSRISDFFKSLMCWRKEIGIWSMILAIIHVLIVLDGWIEWRWMELFGFSYLMGGTRLVLVDPGFGLANIIGIIAIFYGLVLLITSNRISVRIIGASSWKHLHQRFIHLLYLLAALHTAYFIYYYFYTYTKSAPPANFFRIVFPLLVVALAVTQLAAFIKMARQNKGK